MTMQELSDNLYTIDGYDRMPVNVYINFVKNMWIKNSAVCLYEKTESGYRIADAINVADISVDDFKKYMKSMVPVIERMTKDKAEKYLAYLYDEYKTKQN